MNIASVKIGFIVTTALCLLLCVILWAQFTQLNFDYSVNNMGNVDELFAGELIKLSLEQLMSIEVANI